MTYVLGELTADEFRNVYKETLPWRREWLSTGSRSALRELVAGIQDTIRPERDAPAKPWYTDQERIVLPAGTLLAGYFLQGPATAVAGAALGLGVVAGGRRLGEFVRHRSTTSALVRWITDTGPPTRRHK
jgi:hypothetical protein